MQINIQQFIQQAGLDEPFYPGKRVVKAFPQPGEYKSHCVVYDWHDPARIRIEIKAGLSGKDLAAKELVKYPISFQAPTFIEIDVKTGAIKTLRASDEDEEEGSDGRKGKSGGGGKRPALNREEQRSSLLSFSSAAEGLVADAGKLVNMVVMGMQIAEEAYGKVLDKFYSQVEHGKIAATDLMAAAGKLITKYTPASFLKPTGNEDKVYKYNREKNEPMFVGMNPG